MQLSNKFLKSYLQVLSENTEEAPDQLSESGFSDNFMSNLYGEKDKEAKHNNQVVANFIRTNVQTGQSNEGEMTNRHLQNPATQSYFRNKNAGPVTPEKLIKHWNEQMPDKWKYELKTSNESKTNYVVSQNEEDGLYYIHDDHGDIVGKGYESEEDAYAAYGKLVGEESDELSEAPISSKRKELIKLERYVQDVYSDLYSLDNNLDLLAKHGYTSYQDIDNMIELLSKFKNELDQLDRQMRSIYTDSRNSTNESSLNEEVDINSDSYKIGYKLAGQSGWNSRAEASTFAKSELKGKDKKFDPKEFTAGWNSRKGKK
jgi:hypothetical protein